MYVVSFQIKEKLFTLQGKKKGGGVESRCNVATGHPLFAFFFLTSTGLTSVSETGLRDPLEFTQGIFCIRTEQLTSNLSSLMRSKDSFTRMKQSSGRNTSSIYSEIFKR